MIDLRDFTDIVGTMPRSDGRAYIYVPPVMQKKTGAYIVLPRNIAEEATKYFGGTCNVLKAIDNDRLRLAIVRGANKRFSFKSKASLRAEISIAALSPKLVDMYGENIRRVYLSCRWENDQNGNKFVLLESTGDKEYRA